MTPPGLRENVLSGNRMRTLRQSSARSSTLMRMTQNGGYHSNRLRGEMNFARAIVEIRLMDRLYRRPALRRATPRASFCP